VGYVILEGMQIYNIYNAIIDAICLMVILLRVKEIAMKLLRDKSRDPILTESLLNK